MEKSALRSLLTLEYNINKTGCEVSRLRRARGLKTLFKKKIFMKTIKAILISLFTLFVLSAKGQTSTVLEGYHILKRIQFEGDFLYFTDYQSIKKIDATLQNPTVITVVDGGLDSTQDIAIKDDYLYIAHGNKISKVNINNDTPGILIDVITNINTPYGLCFEGNNLYISSDANVSKIDVTQTNPLITPVVSGLQGIIFAMLVRNNYLYFSSTVSSTFPQQGISKIDLTLASPQIETVFSGVADPKTFIMNGNELIFSELGNLRISSININQPNPTINVIADIPLGPYGLAVKNNILYLAEFFGIPNSRILKIDQPLSLNSYSTNDKLVIYPNPAKDKIYFTNDKPLSNYKIYNLLGQELDQGFTYNNEILIEHIPNGSYFININGVVVKFLKK